MQVHDFMQVIVLTCGVILGARNVYKLAQESMSDVKV